MSGERLAGKIAVIYILSDPRTLEVRYVGKSVDHKARFRSHIKTTKQNHFGCWIRSLLSQGIVPLVEVLEETTNDAAWQEAERFWIETLRFYGCRLLNVCKGGEGSEGWKHTIDARNRIRMAQLGKKRSEETRQKLSSNKISFYVNRKVTLSEEHRRSISSGLMSMSPARKVQVAALKRAAMIGKNRRPCLPEQRDKIRRALTGRKRSPEAIQKAADSHRGKTHKNKGRPMPLWWKQKISEAQRKKRRSPGNEQFQLI